jgi:hypothetical protein
MDTGMQHELGCDCRGCRWLGRPVAAESNDEHALDCECDECVDASVPASWPCDVCGDTRAVCCGSYEKRGTTARYLDAVCRDCCRAYH